MLATNSFDYAIIRVVPRVERGEFVNAGIILFSRTSQFLAAAVELDEERVLALDPSIDLEEARVQLGLIPTICRGDTAGGPIAKLPAPGRFHWLVSPRSTVIQTSPVHSGMCADPSVMLEHLLATMVRLPGINQAS